MPSPFPGMDPYIEAFGPWRDFHHSFVIYMRDAIQPLLRSKYRARVEERVLVDPDERSIYPDVSVLQDATETYVIAALATEEYDPPVVVQTEVPLSEPHQIFLQIIMPGAEAKVITVIEVLSPSNKARGPARRKYVVKQEEILSSDVDLVEIDLLLRGAHVAAVPPEELEDVGVSDYLVSVSRATDRPRFELYPTSLAQRLPRIAVPLLPEDEDVVLNLGTVLTQTYDNAGYGDDLDYTQSLPLPISDEQAARIKSVLEEKHASERSE